MMKRAILLTLMLLQTGACTKSTTPSPVPPPDSPVSIVLPPNQPVPSAPSPSPVEPRSGLLNVHPVQWQDATVGADNRTLTLTYYTGIPACYGLDRVDVVYGAKAITVTLYEGTVPGSQVCPDIAMLASTIVALDQAVAGREIVDGGKPPIDSGSNGG